MNAPLDDVCLASLPAAALPLLADLRVRPDVRVTFTEGRAWVRWEPGDGAVVQRVLAVRGADVFARRGGLWYRPGRSLPAFGIPADEGARPLLHVLSPAPVRAEEVTPQPRPVRLGMVRDDWPRPAAALDCPLGELGRWADRATSRQLAALEAAIADPAQGPGGPRVLLLGARLPPLADGVRYWGATVLVPLGFRPQPALPEGALREALGLGPGEWALLHEDGAEVMPRAAFRPVTRAGVRRALREYA
jgi:hypothetical protein